MSLQTRSSLRILFFGLCVLSGCVTVDEADSPTSPPRPLWNASRVDGTPEPPPPYKVELRYRDLCIFQPLGFYPEPGTRRVLIVQHLGHWGGPGRIVAMEDREDAHELERLLDLKDIIYGLEYHPEYEKNGHIFIVSSDMDSKPLKMSTLSRFTVSRHPPYTIDPSSRVRIIDWGSEVGGHTGGAVAFGPEDPYLYVSVGDGGNEGDEYLHAQNLGTIHGSMIRIDVLHPDPGKPYSIPDDNPFVDTPGARPEIWAYGLRNPWRMSFDHETGFLWVGSNGQDLWEHVYVIRKGANYGWPVMEGAHPYNLKHERGPTPISGPIVDHPHSEARSLSGGLVYHGHALSELRGAYIYADWRTGKIWALQYDGERMTYHEEIADSTLSIVGFGVDHDGELIVIDQGEGGFYRLVPTDDSDYTENFPRTLSETGLFTSVEDHALHPGLLPYEVNVAQFSGGSRAECAIALPGESQVTYTGGNGWAFADGAVLIKTLSMPTTSSSGDDWQRIETQMLHKLDGEWQAYSYQWNEDGTDATLVDRNGAEKVLQVRDPTFPSGSRQHTWKFSARAECMMCHSRAAEYVLGITAPQMHRSVQHQGSSVAQIERLRQLGVLTIPEEAQLDKIPQLVDPHDPSHDLDLRARSYLHATCHHCHRQDGGGNARVHLGIGDELEDMRLINEPASHGLFGLDPGEIVAPGDADRSVLSYRLSTMGGARMPRLGSSEVDTRAVALIRDWIDSMDGDADDPHRQEEREAVRQIREARTADDTVKRVIEKVLTSTSASMGLAEVVASGQVSASVKHATLELATAHERPQTRDLFERFLPEERRTKRLGDWIDAKKILAMSGDVERGRRLYDDGNTAQCKSCHRYREGPQRMGPDLTQIGAKLKRAEILDSMLSPSRKVEPEYLGYLVITTAGDTYTGTVARPNDEEVVIRTAQDDVRLASSDIVQLVPQELSLMPTGLASAMTAQELADLLAFLESAK